MMRPSYIAIIDAIKANKIKIFFILFFDSIQVLCEGGMLASTYYLFEIFQNGMIISKNSEIPFSNLILNILEKREIIIIPLLIILISFALIQSTFKYLGQINIQMLELG